MLYLNCSEQNKEIDCCERKIIFSEKELNKRYAELAPKENVDLVVIGCPQASYEEIQETEKLLRNNEIPDKRLWVFTSKRNYERAYEEGIVESIEASGAMMLKNTCPEVVPYDREKVKSRQGDYLQSIFVELSLPIDEVQRQDWRDLGIKVGDGEERVENNTWIWATIVVGMLGLGIWHLISQARKNLRYGSPRQWLEVVDREFQEGIISKEERDSRIEEISARL